MSNNVSVLKRTDPEVLCEGVEAIVVLLKVWHRFFINRPHVEGLDYIIHWVNSIFFQSANSTSFFNPTFVESYCKLIDNSLSVI